MTARLARIAFDSKRPIRARPKDAAKAARVSERMASVGQLAAEITHEINNPLQYIESNVRFIQDIVGDFYDLLAEYRDGVKTLARTDDDHKVVERLAETEKRLGLEELDDEVSDALSSTLEGISRITAIIRNVRDLAHGDADIVGKTDVNRSIENALTVLREQTCGIATVETALGPLPTIEAHGVDIEQIVVNLVVNGMQAIEDGDIEDGHITVATYHFKDAIEIRVTDNGPGIPTVLRAQIFEDFFTTKALGCGTGQGLPLVRKIVEDRYAGEITLDSEIGHGTTFAVRLPVTQPSTGTDVS